MNALNDYEILKNALWRTISTARTELGYAVFEARDRFWRERLAEAVLRVAGVALILVGYFQWFLPDTVLHGNPVLARMALSAAFMGTGICLYLFASRGFRKEVHFEAGERQLSIGRLNSKDRCLISRQIPLDRIESLIVNRANAQQPLATLNVRLKGFPRSFCIMRGAQSEIEELHRQLCRDVQLALMIPEPGTVRSRIRPVMHPKTASPKPVPVFRATPNGAGKIGPARWTAPGGNVRICAPGGVVSQGSIRF